METPFQIKKVKETDNFGIFTFEPLERGYGDTLGNSLRRVLLNSIPGAAIVQTKIKKARCPVFPPRFRNPSNKKPKCPDFV